MKKCKHCQKEIPLKATRCQHCSSDLRNWFRKHWIITTILVVVVIMLVFPSDDSNKDNSSTSTQDEPAEIEEVIIITADELFEAYSQNEIAADQKYDEEMLEVSGIIQNIGKDIMDDMYVSLKTNDIIGSVQCMLADGETSKAVSLTEGESITLVGKNTGLLMNVLLRDCVIQ